MAQAQMHQAEKWHTWHASVLPASDQRHNNYHDCRALAAHLSYPRRRQGLQLYLYRRGRRQHIAVLWGAAPEEVDVQSPHRPRFAMYNPWTY